MKFIYLNICIFPVDEIKEISFFKNAVFTLKDGSELCCDPEEGIPSSLLENEILEFLQNKKTLLNLNQVCEFWFYEKREKERREEGSSSEFLEEIERRRKEFDK